MSSESKFGMLLGLVCVVMFAVILAGPKLTDLKNTPTPGGGQPSPRLEVPIADV